MTKPDEQEIFHAARRIEMPDARRAYLDSACADEPGLRARVEALLRIHDEEQSFLRSPPEGLQAQTTFLAGEAPGTVIGSYKLLEQIGEGGFGVVFMAEQQHPVCRKVALKILKPGMDTRQVVARFEAERQALALMDHPNIALVLEGGETVSGRPYFVMELVRGICLTDFCDEKRLSVRRRLELFVSLCQAVQHAHTKGIIHRDLKPSNVLVTLHDGTPVVKVIDFGIAKALGQKLTDKTLFTGFAQMVGTPLYMSPEQAQMSGLDIDTRTDIYALGVILYELLTGSTPFEKERLREVPFDELRRIIREEEPARPSARISTLADSATASENRGSDPKRLSGQLRGELDWIVMKCLEKDRDRRYETANALARDVQRYLNDEPVEACPPSASYRLRKFVTRHKGQVVAAGLVLLALLAGMAGTTWGMFRAQQERQDAERARWAEAERAEEVQTRLGQVERGTEILASVFRDVDPKTEQKEGVTLRVLMGRRLDEAVRLLEGESAGDPLVVARLQHLLGVALRELGHPQQAEVVLVKARLTREQLLEAGHLDIIATRHHLASAYRDQGKNPQAEMLSREVVDARTAQLGPEHTDTLSSKNNLALVYMSRGKFPLAEQLLQDVLKVRIAKLGANDPKTLQSKHNLASLYLEQRKYAEAEKPLQEVLTARTARLGPGHPDTLLSKNNLAGLYLEMKRFDRAIPLFEEMVKVSTKELGPTHPTTLGGKANLASCYVYQEKYTLAEPLLKEVRDAQTIKLGAGHTNTLDTKGNLAVLYWRMKDRKRAILMYEEVLELSKATLDRDHPETLFRQKNLGVLYHLTGRFPDAIRLLEEVYQKGRKHPRLADIGKDLLSVYVAAGKTKEVVALAREQEQAARKQYPAGSLQLAAALTTTGKALLEVKAYTQAEPLLRENLSLREKLAPPLWDTDNARSMLGGALQGQKKYAEAEQHLVQGYTGMKKHEGRIPRDGKSSLTDALERLVRLYGDWGKPDEAARWRKELEARKSAPQK